METILKYIDFHLLIGVIGGIVVFVLVRYFLFPRKKSQVILAEIEKIEPIFIKNHKHYEAYLTIYYAYYVKKKKYQGYCKIPFSILLDNQNSAELFFHKELDLPVLNINQEVIIGNEAIEHKLMQMLPYLPIRYLISDPSRNFVLPLNRKYGIFKKKIKKIS